MDKETLKNLTDLTQKLTDLTQACLKELHLRGEILKEMTAQLKELNAQVDKKMAE